MSLVNSTVLMVNECSNNSNTVLENASASAFQPENVLKPILITACVEYNIKFCQINYHFEDNRFFLVKNSHGNIVKIINVVDMDPKNEINGVIYLSLESLLRVEEAFKPIEFHALGSKFKGFEYLYCRNNFIREIAVRTLMTCRKNDDLITLHLSKEEQDISQIIDGFRFQYSFQTFNYGFSKYLESMNIKFQLHDTGVLNLCKDGLSIFVFGFINYGYKIDEHALMYLLKRMCCWTQFNINQIYLTLASEENHQWDIYQSQGLKIKDFNQGPITENYIDDLEAKIALNVQSHQRENNKEEQIERMINQLKKEGVLKTRDIWLVQLLGQCQNINEGDYFLNGEENLAKLLFKQVSFNQSDEHKKKGFTLFLACIRLNLINKKNIQDFDALLDEQDCIELFKECTLSLSEEKKKRLKDNIKKRFGYLKEEAINLCERWEVLSEDDKTESASLRQKQSRASQKLGEIANESPSEKKNSKKNHVKEPDPVKDQAVVPTLKEICEFILDEIISDVVRKSTMNQNQVNPELAQQESVEEESVEIKTMEDVLESKHTRLGKILLTISKSQTLEICHIKRLVKFKDNKVFKTLKIAGDDADVIEFWECIVAMLEQRSAKSCFTLKKIIEAALTSKNIDKLSEQSLLEALRLNQESQRKDELKKQLLEQAIQILQVRSLEDIKVMSKDLDLYISEIYKYMLNEQSMTTLQCNKKNRDLFETKTCNPEHAQLVIIFEVGIFILPLTGLRKQLK